MAKNATEILNDLISTCRDSQEGFSKAAKGVHSDDLRRVFMNIFEKRGRYVDELRNLVLQERGTLADFPHGGGPLHRGWTDLETRIRPKSDPEFLNNCLDGDSTTLNHYIHALDSGLLTERQRLAVERQLAGIRNDHEELRATQMAHQGS
jgi:uncharacterized protein (TIGR02284 family)